MKVIISDHSREKVYHHIGCPHVKRITIPHRMDITIGRANVLGYRKCKCCCNLKGTIRALTNSLETLGAGRDMEITYQPVTDTLYMRTANGFWKTYWNKDQGLLLYHLNCYDASKATSDLAHDSFHRQKDVQPTESLDRILQYVEEHDKAKAIIADDYRKLPQKTRKQRMYYRQAESRHKKAQINKVFALFASLEKTSDLAQFAFC